MVAMDTAVAEQEADTTAGYYGQDGGSNGSDGEDSDSYTGGKGSPCTPTGYKIHIELPIFVFVSGRARPSSGSNYPLFLTD